MVAVGCEQVKNARMIDGFYLILFFSRNSCYLIIIPRFTFKIHFLEAQSMRLPCVEGTEGLTWIAAISYNCIADLTSVCLLMKHHYGR